METETLDYGHGYTYRLCCIDPPCGLGDLLWNGVTIQAGITQREARKIQAEREQ